MIELYFNIKTKQWKIKAKYPPKYKKDKLIDDHIWVSDYDFMDLIMKGAYKLGYQLTRKQKVSTGVDPNYNQYPYTSVYIHNKNQTPIAPFNLTSNITLPESIAINPLNNDPNYENENYTLLTDKTLKHIKENTDLSQLEQDLLDIISSIVTKIVKGNITIAKMTDIEKLNDKINEIADELVTFRGRFTAKNCCQHCARAEKIDKIFTKALSNLEDIHKNMKDIEK